MEGKRGDGDPARRAVAAAEAEDAVVGSPLPEVGECIGGIAAIFELLQGCLVEGRTHWAQHESGQCPDPLIAYQMVVNRSASTPTPGAKKEM